MLEKSAVLDMRPIIFVERNPQEGTVAREQTWVEFLNNLFFDYLFDRKLNSFAGQELRLWLEKELNGHAIL